MQSKLTFREMVKYRAGTMCLIGILAATFLHTSAFMATFFYDSLILGCIAAFAVDAGIVAMSIYKDEMMNDGQIVFLVRLVTIIVLIASAVANMSEGFKSAYDIQLTFASFMAMDIFTVVQWLCGTLIFPILAYIMCDVVSHQNLVSYNKEPDYNSQIQQGQDYLEAARKKASSNKARRMKKLMRYLDENPDATLKEMADHVGVNSRTVSTYIKEAYATETGGFQNGSL